MSDNITISITEPTPTPVTVSITEPIVENISIVIDENPKGIDGADGITPLLSASNTALEVSVDNGSTYSELVDYQTIIDASDVSTTYLTYTNALHDVDLGAHSLSAANLTASGTVEAASYTLNGGELSITADPVDDFPIFSTTSILDYIQFDNDIRLNENKKITVGIDSGKLWGGRNDVAALTTDLGAGMHLNNDGDAEFDGDVTVANKLKVGGTLPPTYNLEIGDVGDTGTMRINSFGSGVAGIRMMEDAGGGDAYGHSFGYDAGTNDFRILRHQNSTAGTPVMSIARTVNRVSIGTTSYIAALGIKTYSTGVDILAGLDSSGATVFRVDGVGGITASGTVTANSATIPEIQGDTTFTDNVEVLGNVTSSEVSVTDGTYTHSIKPYPGFTNRLSFSLAGGRSLIFYSGISGGSNAVIWNSDPGSNFDLSPGGRKVVLGDGTDLWIMGTGADYNKYLKQEFTSGEGRIYSTDGKLSLQNTGGDTVIGGKVGIGTATPSTPLHVVGALRVDNGATSGGLNFGANVNSTTRSSNIRKLATIVSPDYSNTRNIEWLSSDSGSSLTNFGYIGGRIGGSSYALTDLWLTTSPSNSTTGGVSRIYIDKNGNIEVNETGIDSNFRIATSGEPNAFFVEGSSGNVGIGTDTPSEKLEVNGNAKIIDNLDVGGTAEVVGELTAIGQPAVGSLTDLHVLVKALADSLYGFTDFPMGRYANWAVNGGGNSFSSYWVSVNTGTGGGTSIGGGTISDGFQRGPFNHNGNPQYLPWDRRVRIRIGVFPLTFSGDGTLWFWLGSTTATPTATPTQNGYGFSLTSAGIQAHTYNGTLTSGAIAPCSVNTVTQNIELEIYGGTINLLLNGVLVSTASGGTTSATETGRSVGIYAYSDLSDGTANNYARAELRDFKYRITDT